MKNKTLLTLPLTLSLCLAGCGGGGGGTSSAGQSAQPPATPPPSAGLWVATTSSGRSGNLILLDDGGYYFLYSTTTDPTILGGAIQGHASGTSNSVSSTDGIDFSWERLDGSLTTLSASLDAQSGLAGTVTYDTVPGRNFSFTSTYRPATNELVSLAQMAGRFISTDGTMSLDIAASGAISGTAFSSTCGFTGSVTQTKNYTTIMNLSITFLGGTCSFGTSTIKGLALYNSANREIIGIAVNDERSRTALFQANKR
jgi:hypothetical protein